MRRLVRQAIQQNVELLEHRFVNQRRSNARARTGPGWQRQGQALFTYADGRPIRPEYLSHRFRTLVKQLGLPPIRLHDLRHGAATVALAAHADLKVIQHMLGHASIVTTADTYTSVLPEVAHTAAQASADLIMQVARSRHSRRDVVDAIRYVTHPQRRRLAGPTRRLPTLAATAGNTTGDPKTIRKSTLTAAPTAVPTIRIASCWLIGALQRDMT